MLFDARWIRRALVKQLCPPGCSPAYRARIEGRSNDSVRWPVGLRTAHAESAALPKRSTDCAVTVRISPNSRLSSRGREVEIGGTGSARLAGCGRSSGSGILRERSCGQSSTAHRMPPTWLSTRFWTCFTRQVAFPRQRHPPSEAWPARIHAVPNRNSGQSRVTGMWRQMFPSPRSSSTTRSGAGFVASARRTRTYPGGDRFFASARRSAGVRTPRDSL